jgi:hypothetical protein
MPNVYAKAIRCQPSWLKMEHGESGMKPASNNSPLQLWQGEMRTIDQVYKKGWEDANQHERVSMHSSARFLADEVTKMILQPSTRAVVEKHAPGTWPGFMRAAEHIVSDLDPASAATPHGTFPVQGWNSEFSEELAATWVTDSMPSLRYANLIENAPGQPIPQLPTFATYPTAGRQPGEKLEMYSKAFDIVPDDGTVIDGSLYLNVSYLLQDAGFGPLIRALMQSAVSAEANAQIAKAVEAAATAGGLDIFTGRYVPNVAIVPPNQLDTVNAVNLSAAGITVVLEPNVTKVLYADKNAIVGFFRKMNMESPEPDVYGVGISYKVWGKVAVDSTGVGSVAVVP